MTQDVQPLTWQKRTNLEEHQQFFSKINEIIGNLAPTVDEAEQAIAQATQAIADANAAIATANAASAAADAAAQQAQTAASTVAGYDTRLTAAEGDIDALQAADQTMAGNINALGTRMTAAESKNSQQDTSIAALQTADENNVKITGTHAIGNYALLLTGNQTALGYKQIPEMARLKSTHTASADNYLSLYEIAITNNLASGVFEVYDRSNHTFGVYYVDIRNFSASTVKLYGNTTADRFAIAISADRTKMYVFVRSSRVNADVKWCGYAWQEEFIGSLITVNNNIEETVETLVAGDTYLWVGKA